MAIFIPSNSQYALYLNGISERGIYGSLLLEANHCNLYKCTKLEYKDKIDKCNKMIYHELCCFYFYKTSFLLHIKSLLCISINILFIYFNFLSYSPQRTHEKSTGAIWLAHCGHLDVVITSEET